MNKIKILITGANGDIAYSIFKIIKKSFKNFLIHGAEINDEWSAKLFYDKLFYLPLANKKEYPGKLHNLIRKNKYDFVIPTNDNELLAIIKSKKLINHQSLLLLSKNIIKIFSDKYKTSIWMKKNNIPFAKTYNLENNKSFSFPIFVKPRIGHGSKNIFIIKNNKELQGLKKLNLKNMIVQEYLNYKDEYTCVVLKLGKDIKTIIMKRLLIEGTTHQIKIINNKIITKLLIDFAKKIDLFGSINVQLKITSKGPVIFEVNPRFSGTVYMRHLLGFDDLKWILNYKMNKKNFFTNNLRKKRIVRLSHEFIF